MSDKSVTTGDMQNEQATTKELIKNYNQNMSSYGRLSERSPYDGALDRNGELRLRLAIIDNPEINRSENSDPVDVTNVVNLANGQVTLTWVDLPGGSIRPSEMSGEWKHLQENDKANPEERDYNEWKIESKREMVSLTQPFFWSDQKNWCGMNHIPPVGSMVVVGFRKHGLPIILGYLPTTFKNCYPVLKPGETIIKGYGNNYMHCRWSDKLDLKAWSNYDHKDIDDPKKNSSNPKKNTTNCTLWLRLNANDRYIKIQASENDPGNKEHGSHSTTAIIKPRDFSIVCSDLDNGKSTQYYQNESSIQLKGAVNISGSLSVSNSLSVSGSTSLGGSVSCPGYCYGH